MCHSLLDLTIMKGDDSTLQKDENCKADSHDNLLSSNISGTASLDSTTSNLNPDTTHPNTQGDKKSNFSNNLV